MNKTASIALVTLATLLAGHSAKASITVTYTNGQNDLTNRSTNAPNDPTTLTIASGAARQTGNITGTGGVIKTGAGTLYFYGANTYSGGTTISNGILAMNEEIQSRVDAGTATITLGDINTGANNVGFGLANTHNSSASNPMVVSALGSGTATIGANFFYSVNVITYSGSLTLNRPTILNQGTNNGTIFSGKISGNVGTITITGGSLLEPLRFTNNLNDFFGNIVVSPNTAFSAADGTLPDTTSIYLPTDSRLNLFTNGAIDTVESLYLNNVKQIAGIWGAVGSGAPNESLYLTGAGRLNVTNIPEPTSALLLLGSGAMLLRRRRRTATLASHRGV